MLEDYGAMRRKIDARRCFIEQSAGAPLGQLLPRWQRATGWPVEPAHRNR
jgi:hypothetical protein